MDLLPILGLVCVLIWVYLLFLRGGFWRVRANLAGSQTDTRRLPVAVVIPARNEAATIGKSISSLLEQQTVAEVHVIVVDDDSSDGTAEVARQAAAAEGKENRLTIVHGATLPAGWTGKLWAVQQGLREAQQQNPEYFLLTDADIQHGPRNLVSLLEIAEAGKYDLTSFMVGLRCETLAEKLLIPPFVYFFFKLYPPAWIRSERHKTAAAAGGCMLVRAAALTRIGGMESIRGELIDDCALANAIKQSGGRVWLGLTNSAQSLRAYNSLSEIERMISRTAFNQLRHSTLLLLAVIAGMAATYLLPPALLFSGGALPVSLGAAACIMMAGSYLPIVRFYRLNPVWSLALPVAALFYLRATTHSALNYWSGRGGEWKGRTQDRARFKQETDRAP